MEVERFQSQPTAIISCLHLCPFPPSYAAQRQTIEKPEVALRNKYIYSTLTFKCQELKRWLVLFAPHTYAKCNHGNPWEDLLSSVCFRSCKRRMLHVTVAVCPRKLCLWEQEGAWDHTPTSPVGGKVCSSLGIQPKFRSGLSLGSCFHSYVTVQLRKGDRGLIRMEEMGT